MYFLEGPQKQKWGPLMVARPFVKVITPADAIEKAIADVMIHNNSIIQEIITAISNKQVNDSNSIKNVLKDATQHETHDPKSLQDALSSPITEATYSLDTLQKIFLTASVAQQIRERILTELNKKPAAIEKFEQMVEAATPTADPVTRNQLLQKQIAAIMTRAKTVLPMQRTEESGSKSKNDAPPKTEKKPVLRGSFVKGSLR